MDSLFMQTKLIGCHLLYMENLSVFSLPLARWQKYCNLKDTLHITHTHAHTQTHTH